MGDWTLVFGARDLEEGNTKADGVEGFEEDPTEPEVGGLEYDDVGSEADKIELL